MPPALVLTARDAIRDRVEGFERGADDYLVKPFAMAELIARVQMLCRRRARSRRRSCGSGTSSSTPPGARSGAAGSCSR